MEELPTQPDKEESARTLFNIDCDMKVPCFSETTSYVPEIDPNYVFDYDTTLALIAGFKYNRRVMIQGYHGTGKSTHVEQVAARLNWPCVRVNLDAHISRIDLIGKDAIKLKDGKQITEFQEGILPWALQNPIAICFDEYDAGRPDVMFVIQRILEQQGKLTLLDQTKVITPHTYFRIFATANTIGLGDSSGLYHGTNAINQGQMDRWSILTTLNYMTEDEEANIVAKKCPSFNDKQGWKQIRQMVQLASLTREGFMNGSISSLMSPRTVLTWAENADIYQDITQSFIVSFYNKVDETERPILAEYYKRVFDVDIVEKVIVNS